MLSALIGALIVCSQGGSLLYSPHPSNQLGKIVRKDLKIYPLDPGIKTMTHARVVYVIQCFCAANLIYFSKYKFTIFLISSQTNEFTRVGVKDAIASKESKNHGEKQQNPSL